MYFEVFKQGNLIVRGTKILNTISIDNELMVAPSTTLVLPVDWRQIIDGREEVKIFLDECRVFWGIVWDFTVNKDDETIELDIRHVVTEWQYRQISVNHAISNEALNIVYKGDKVEKNETSGETITASDFKVIDEKIDGMKLADWVAKASVSAWVTSNGDKVAVTKVDTSKLEKEDGKWKEGTYDVTFGTANGTTITVSCSVGGTIDLQNRETKTSKANKETISAIPFTVDVSKGMTAEQVKKKADPKAWEYRHKKNKVAVTSVITNFRNEEGEYTLTASTQKGTSITVEIKVESFEDEYSVLNDPAVVDKLEDIYSDMNFAYPGWQIEFQDDTQLQTVDYVYSRQNKLEALTQTMELTYDTWWRVGLWNEKKIQIGRFGDEKPYIISRKPSGRTNIHLITEPTIEPDFENVINVATVYSDKTDGGMSSLTLREVYMDPSLQHDGFPVVILHANVNNERDYSKYIEQFPKLAPNNEIEYAVIDEESIALESGTLIEGTYYFNDYSPFELDGKRIEDEKRTNAAKTVYEAVIRKLIQARRSYDIKIITEPVPCDLEVGDKIRLLYDNNIWQMQACSSYWKKMLSVDDFYYVTRIAYNYDEYGNLTNELTLTKWLKIDRDTDNTQG